jgi:hypothetical protein
VWYVDITPGHDWLTNRLNALIAEAVAGGAFTASHIARLLIRRAGHLGVDERERDQLVPPCTDFST